MSAESRIGRFYARSRASGASAVNIVAFGDSVTQGARELGVLKPRETYHYFLHQSLEEHFPLTTFNTINSGISGETVAQGSRRLEQDVLSHRPDLVLVAFGLNDAAEGLDQLHRFKEQLGEVVEQIYRSTPAAVVLLSPPAMATQRSNRIHPKHEPVADTLIEVQSGGILKQFAQSVGELAREKAAPFVDVYAGWERLMEDGVDCNAWFANGLNHPDERGHRLAHTLLWHALLEEFGER